MTDADKAIISAALLAYAELTERSPMRHYCPEGMRAQADRCRDLAKRFDMRLQKLDE